MGGADAPLTTYLGINVSARVVYFGVARDGQLVLDDPAERVEPSAELDDARRIDDVRVRVRQEIRRLQPVCLGVMRPRRYSGWKWSDAFSRATLEAAVMMAAVDEGAKCDVVRAEDAARAVPAAPSKVVEQAADRWGVNPTAQWEERVWAFATAMALAGGVAE
jgi:hypothetical protein